MTVAEVGVERGLKSSFIGSSAPRLRISPVERRHGDRQPQWRRCAPVPEEYDKARNSMYWARARKGPVLGSLPSQRPT
jgi:hypothetical protein